VTRILQLFFAQPDGVENAGIDAERIDQGFADGLGAPLAEFEIVFAAADCIGVAATQAETRLVGLFSLVPAVADAVRVPVIATGGIADGRTIAAALLLGASAVQIGTAFLRCPEAKIPSAWADAIGKAAPEDTLITRALTGRPARCIETGYVRAAMAPSAPAPAPYPVQRAKRVRKPTMSTACKPGPANPQDWQGPSQPAKSCDGSGRRRKDC
jgi:NAD(P)H-dependent flavin oxidoreductase YrpB (nitropropane dioxygenase family)